MTPEGTTELLERAIVERVLGEALAKGGDFAEVFVEEKRSFSASLDDARVEEISNFSAKGVGIRVVKGDTTGFAHSADLSEGALLEAARAAAAVAKSTDGPAGGGSGRPRVAIAGAPFVPRTPAGFSEEDLNRSAAKTRKVELLRAGDEAARSAGSQIAQVSVGYSDSTRRILVANSEGVFASDFQPRLRLVVTCVASGDTGLQTGYEVMATTDPSALLGEDEVIQVAQEAARRALVKLEARPAPSGMLPVVLAKGSGGILFHEACGHGLEADHIRKGASVYTGKVGSKVASELVTLVDDGTPFGQWGASGIDDEGRPVTRQVLIENGVLVDYMWDWLRARQAGHAPSANGRRQSYEHLPMVRMTNTYLLPGKDDPEAIVASTEHGVYVAKLGGGQVNTATGDFVFGTVEAYLIEHGRLTAPLHDMNLVGNGPDILSKVDALGSDFGMTPGTCGKDGQLVPVGCGQPTLRVNGITIGGTAG